MWFNISFIDEDKIMEQYLKQCPICKDKYMKRDFVKCSECSKVICLNCTVIAGKLGKFCRSCFSKLPKKKKEEIAKIAKKMKFWAQYGYYAFILLFIIGIVFFSLTILDFMFFFGGLIVVAFAFLYGLYLFKYLNQWYNTLNKR